MKGAHAIETARVDRGRSSNARARRGRRRQGVEM
jgi:hypothetical protein